MSTDEPVTRPGGSRRWIAGAVAAAVVVAAVVIGVVVLLGDDGPADDGAYTVVVPAGTSARIAAGEDIALMPERVELSVGDRLVIDNRDSETVEVGPFAVRPGETFEYTFRNAGRYIGYCSIGENSQIEIVVS